MRYKKQYREKRVAPTRSRIYPYKSTLEHKLATEYLEGWEYEPSSAKVSYSVPHVYNPDFIHPKQPDILAECKGYFIKGSADCQKYLSIIRDNPDKELVFIFSDPSKKCYSGCQPRKDGSYLSLGEWCKSHDVLYFKVTEIPKDFIKGKWSVDDCRQYKKTLYQG